MSENRSADPKAHPEQAAHEVILELCKAGAFNGSFGTHKFPGRNEGDTMGNAVTTAYQRILSAYKS